MKRIFDGLALLLTWLCLGLLIIYTILVAVQVISRYAFHSPTTWTELVARYLFVWSIMLYMPVLFRIQGNAAFDLILKKLKPSKFRIVRLLNNGFVLMGAIFLVRWGFVFCSKMSNKYMVGLGSEVRIPMNYAYLAIPIGATLLILMCLEQIVSNLREIITGAEKC
jgi:TRAP-type C4-dicarboxylate transport system permease small subunit